MMFVTSSTPDVVDVPPAPSSRPRDLKGDAALPGLLFIIMVLAAMVMPTSFLLYSPGPADDVTGHINNEPLVEVADLETYPTDTDLYMTTVNSRGTPQAGANGLEVVYATLSKNIRSQPLRLVYGADETQEQVRSASFQMMTSSQEMAAAIAQEQAGLDVEMTLTIAGFGDGAQAADVLEVDDVIVALRAPSTNGEFVEAKTFHDVTSILEQTPPASTVTLRVLRDGEEVDADVVTRPYDPDVNGWVNPGSLMGILIGVTDLQMPGEVSYLIDGIGGPSAGSVFAASIYDMITPGSLGGENKIAGTGTLSWDGRINAIGGIRQKLVGADNQGTDNFFAPITNCQETVGYVPDGMSVWAVSDFEDVINVIEAVGDGDTSGLTSCADVAADVPAEYQRY